MKHLWHRSSRIMHWVVIGLALVCACAAVWVATAHTRTGSTVEARSFAGFSVRVPAGWSGAREGNVWTWTCVGGLSRVQATSLPAGSEQLDGIVLRSAQQMRQHLVGYTGRLGTIRFPDGQRGWVHQFRAQGEKGQYELWQIWRRSRDGGRDALVTWSRSQQDPPRCQRVLELALLAGLVEDPG